MLSTSDKCANMRNNMDFKEILKQINCAEQEINTFIALFSEKEGVSALQLSKKINLPRPTIYGHLNSLIEKGLAKKGLNENGAVFYAEDLNSILNLYNEKIKSIEQAKKTLEELTEIKGATHSYKPKFIVYDNPKASESILRDVLRSRAEQTYWFWPVKEMIKTISHDTLAMFNEERLKRNIWLNVLWTEKQKVELENHPFLGPADPKKSLRRIRMLPKKIDYMMGYGIYGNKVAFVSSKRENYGFIVDSQELSNTLKSQFDYLWNISKKL